MGDRDAAIVLGHATDLLLALQCMLAEACPHSEDPRTLAEVSWHDIGLVVEAANALALDVTILADDPPDFTMPNHSED
jgi:hypothetical protein